MAVAMLQEWAPSDDRSTTNYDSFGEKLGVDAFPAEGLLIHSAGFSDDGTFRIYEVWESREAQARFEDERMRPIIEEMMATGAGSPPVRKEVYELHAVIEGT
jgi:hypothetical protein